MEQLIKQIEQWAEDRNIINGTNPIDQAMKLFSEFGELADNVGKGRDCRDDIGDVFVVLTIISKQYKSSILMIDEYDSTIEGFADEKHCVLKLSYFLHDFVQCGGHYLDTLECLNALDWLANKFGYTLEECVQIAYNDIKDRKGKVVNGVFIKESDLKDGE